MARFRPRECMPRPIRVIRPNKLVEVTCRTVQGRFLLKPSLELNRRILGVIGRAQRQTGLSIHAITFASNHYHLLVSPATPKQLVDFMCLIQSNIAREAGDLYDWNGKFWSRRFRDIPVSDEDEAQVERLRYCLAHGVKEGLVAHCRDWPGVHSAAALLDDEPLTGVWYDRTSLYEARRQGKRVRLSDFATMETVELTPLPCWQHLDSEEVRRRVAAMIAGIEEEHRLDREAQGTRVVGANAVLHRDPHQRPEGLKRGPAPRFHTATQAAWLALREHVQHFVEEFRAAVEYLKKGRPEPGFPPGSFPPNLPYVPLLEPG